MVAALKRYFARVKMMFTDVCLKLASNGILLPSIHGHSLMMICAVRDMRKSGRAKMVVCHVPNTKLASYD